mmetsp:Transcript_38279/g.110026  ORF Transcript_38279/g.110026 Transcript_38279/m.110026 type:complete len:330 (-) Transcript_38279:1253-2242(-)
MRDHRVELRRQTSELRNSLRLHNGVSRHEASLTDQGLNLVKDRITLLNLHFRELSKRLVTTLVARCSAGRSVALCTRLGFLGQRFVLKLDTNKLPSLDCKFVAESISRLVFILLLKSMDRCGLRAEFLQLLAALAHTNSAPLAENPVLPVTDIVRLQQVKRVERVAASDQVGACQHFAVHTLLLAVDKHMCSLCNLPDISIHGHALLLDELRRLAFLNAPLAHLAPNQVLRHVLQLPRLDRVLDEVLVNAHDLHLFCLGDIFVNLCIIIRIFRHDVRPSHNALHHLRNTIRNRASVGLDHLLQRSFLQCVAFLQDDHRHAQKEWLLLGR